jgi:hypothetical protein
MQRVAANKTHRSLCDCLRGPRWEQKRDAARQAPGSQAVAGPLRDPATTQALAAPAALLPAALRPRSLPGHAQTAQAVKRTLPCHREESAAIKERRTRSRLTMVARCTLLRALRAARRGTTCCSGRSGAASLSHGWRSTSAGVGRLEGSRCNGVGWGVCGGWGQRRG